MCLIKQDVDEPDPRFAAAFKNLASVGSMKLRKEPTEKGVKFVAPEVDVDDKAGSSSEYSDYVAMDPPTAPLVSTAPPEETPDPSTIPLSPTFHAAECSPPMLCTKKGSSGRNGDRGSKCTRGDRPLVDIPRPSHRKM